MKASSLLIFLVIIGLVAFAFVSFGNELNSQYADNQINTSQIDGTLDYTGEINSSLNPLVDKFDKIADEDAGFFTKLGAGIVAIPYAIVLFPALIFKGVIYLNSVITLIGTALNIPAVIIYGIIVIALIWIISKLLEFFQKTPS